MTVVCVLTRAPRGEAYIAKHQAVPFSNVCQPRRTQNRRRDACQQTPRRDYDRARDTLLRNRAIPKLSFSVVHSLRWEPSSTGHRNFEVIDLPPSVSIGASAARPARWVGVRGLRERHHRQRSVWVRKTALTSI